MPIPDALDEITSSPALSDYSTIDPDVIRTIIGEGDPASVASVLWNRKQKSGLDYSSLITDPSQFSARTTNAWNANSKIAEDSPQYQHALEVAGPILTGHQVPIVASDSFYSPKGMANGSKPVFDDGHGTQGPDGQLYFEGKYVPPSIPDALGQIKSVSSVDSPDQLAHDSATDLVDYRVPGEGQSWPVYDPYNKVGRNADGSIAYVGDAKEAEKQRQKDIEATNATGPVGSPGHSIVATVGSQVNTDPETIQAWLKTHPDDIANKGPQVSGNPIDPTSGGQVGLGIEQGLANVKNSVEGLASPFSAGVRSDLAQGLINRQSNDTINSGSTSYGLGKFGGELLGTAPAMLLPGVGELAEGATAGSNLAPAGQFLAGNFGKGAITRGLSLAARGAEQGAETSALTSAGSNQSLGDQVEGGALTGAIAAPALHGLGSAIANRFMPTVSQHTADMADMAQTKYNYNLRGSQILGAENPSAASTDASLFGLPADQASTRMRNISNTFGEDADTLTQPALKSAQARIGNDINTIAGRNNITNVQGLSDNLDTIMSDAKTSGLSADELRRIQSQVGNIKVMAKKGGQLTGDEYKGLITKDSPLYDAMNDSNPNISRFAHKVKGALDGAFDAEAGTDPVTGLSDAGAMQKARAQYANLMNVSKVVDPSTGKVPVGALSKVLPSSAINRQGSLADLDNIDNLFMNHSAPSSLGSKVKNLLLPGGITSLGLTGAALLHSNPMLAAQTAGASVGAGALSHYIGRPIAEGLNNSSYLRDRLLQGASADYNPTVQYFANKFGAPAATIANQKQGYN